jgi:ABC-2 type transport system permease protein
VTAVDVAVAASARPAHGSQGVIVRYSAKRALRSAVLWGYVFGITVVSSAYSYTRLYKTPGERRRLAETFGANHAASALFGPAPQLQTVAGFTVFKASMTVMIIGAVWGLLTSTRLLRGDEDAGRWEILAVGPTTRAGAVTHVLAGLGCGAAVLWAVTALIVVIAGRFHSVRIGVTAGLFLALALVASAVMFLAVGALTSQVAPRRRTAAAYGAVVLGLSYALRMVGDAGAGLHWLVWTSPLGWVEELRPLTAPRPWVLVPVAALTTGLALVAVVLAGRRDVGAGLWPERAASAPRLGLLAGPAQLTLRLTTSSAGWWALSTAAIGLLYGVVAKAAGTTIGGSSVQKVFSRLGAPGTGTTAVLGIAFVIMAIVIGFQSVSQLSATRAEEADGRLDHLVAGAVGRVRWFAGRMSVAAAALFVSALGAGLFTWIGTVSQGSGVGLPTVLNAGVNTVAPAAFLLGAGACVFGLRPRVAVGAVYALLGWSALIDLVGGFFAQNGWVLDTSLFHHMASAPAVAPDWRANGVLLGLGLVGMLLGAAAFGHRDLQGE